MNGDHAAVGDRAAGRICDGSSDGFWNEIRCDDPGESRGLREAGDLGLAPSSGMRQSDLRWHLCEVLNALTHNVAEDCGNQDRCRKGAPSHDNRSGIAEATFGRSDGTVRCPCRECFGGSTDDESSGVVDEHHGRHGATAIEFNNLNRSLSRCGCERARRAEVNRKYETGVHGHAPCGVANSPNNTSISVLGVWGGGGYPSSGL